MRANSHPYKGIAMKDKFLYWWLLNCLSVAGFYLLYDFNVLELLYLKDSTYITSLITLLFVCATASIGHKFKKLGINTSYHIEGFVSHCVITLGMIGTIVGFMIMLAGTVDNIQLADVEAVRKLLGSLTAGLYTAMNTTLVGLVTSLHIKTQFIILGIDRDEEQA